jgi:hypothetical protein
MTKEMYVSAIRVMIVADLPPNHDFENSISWFASYPPVPYSNRNCMECIVTFGRGTAGMIFAATR